MGGLITRPGNQLLSKMNDNYLHSNSGISGMTDHLSTEAVGMVPWFHLSQCPGTCLSSWRGHTVRVLAAGGGGVDLFQPLLSTWCELSSHPCRRNMRTTIFSNLQIRPPMAERRTGMYPRSHSCERHGQGLAPGSLPPKAWHRGKRNTRRSFPASLKGSPRRRVPVGAAGASMPWLHLIVRGWEFLLPKAALIPVPVCKFLPPNMAHAVSL